MGSLTSPSEHLDRDHEYAVSALEQVSRTVRSSYIRQHGKLEVVKLARLKLRGIINASTNELVIAAKPASSTSCVRWVHFHFTDREKLPKPELVESEARIQLFFARSEFDAIVKQLQTRKDHFCYFWQTLDASKVTAWLFQPA